MAVDNLPEARRNTGVDLSGMETNLRARDTDRLDLYNGYGSSACPGRANPIFSLAALIRVLLCSTALAVNAAERVAYVKGSEVFVTDESSQEGRQLTNNGVPKWLVRWSPSGQFLAYMEMTDSSLAKGRLVVVNANGEVRMQALIHEMEGQRVAGLRWVEELTWFTDDSIGVSGSFNPAHCELIILKPSMGVVLQDVAVDCGSFNVSPDGEHVVYLQTVETGADNRRRDFVLLDRELSLVPPNEASPITVVGMPQWSADGSRIAYVAKTLDEGSVSVVVSDTTGVIGKQEISPSFAAKAVLAWAERSVVVAGNNLTISFDPSTGQWREASPEESAAVGRREALEKIRTDHAQEMRERAKQSDWREVDVWPAEESFSR
jgi:hypothetical protein